MIRFSANLGFLWTELPLLDRIGAAASAGFDAVEFHWPFETSAALVAARCKADGVVALAVNTSPGDRTRGEFGLAAIAGQEAAFLADLDTCLDYCNAIGARSVHVMAGMVRPDERAAARHVLVENLREAATRAAPRGITLLLEAINRTDVPNYFYDGIDDAAGVIREVGAENVKLMFDAYHVGRDGGDIVHAFRKHVAVIGHVQIAAIPSRAEPDEGSFDYRHFFAALESERYDSWVGCEYRPRAATEAGLGWMKTLGVAYVQRQNPVFQPRG